MIFSKILQSIVLVPVSLFPVGRTTSHDVIVCAKLWYISIVLCVCVRVPSNRTLLQYHPPKDPTASYL